MKFFALLVAFIVAGTAIGFAVPTFTAPNSAVAEPEGEMLGFASQTVPGDRDTIFAATLAATKAAIKVARDKGQPGASHVDISSKAPESMLMVLDLPEGGELNIHIAFEQQGASTVLNQKITMSSDISPDLRKRFEGMRDTGAFNMLASGALPPLG